MEAMRKKTAIEKENNAVEQFKNDSEEEVEEAPQDNKDSEMLVKQLQRRRKATEKAIRKTPDSEGEDAPDARQTTSFARSRLRDKILLQTRKAKEEDQGDDYSPPASARSSLLTSPRKASLTLKSPRTDTMEKYRKRFQKMAKEVESKEEEEEEESSERLTRNAMRSTRFDDDLYSEPRTWRPMKPETTDTQPKDPLVPTGEEAYNFFTKIYQEEDVEEEIPPEPEPSTAAPVEPSEEVTETQADQPREATEEPPGDRPEEQPKEDKSAAEKKISGFSILTGTSYVPLKSRLEEEKPIKNRIFDVEQPRFIEDEGFFVGKKPFISRGNLIRMENRLLKQKDQGRNWFGEDGRLIMLPDPLKSNPIKPFVPDDPDLGFTTGYQPTIKLDMDKRIIDSDRGISSNSGKYQLNVDINTIRFTHHHLFSREHVLASILTEYCEAYEERSKQKISDYLSSKIKALKKATEHLERSIEEANETKKKTPTDHINRLKQYKEELKYTREQWHSELSTDRELIRSIIKTWKDLKELRKTQGFFSTPTKLTIHKEEVDKEADNANYQLDVDEEVAEIVERRQENYKLALEKYKEERARYDEQAKARKEARKREKIREKKRLKRQTKKKRGEEEQEEEAIDTEEDELLFSLTKEQERQDLDIINAPQIEKPIKPSPIDQEDVKQKVLDLYSKIRRLPGEHILHPELSSSGTITATNTCPKSEQLRRNEVDKCKLYIKIYFDNKEVCKTSSKPLGQEFTIRFAQVFETRIVRWPENIRLDVYETIRLTTNLLTQIFTGIPEANVTNENVQLDQNSFSSVLKFTYNHEGVGSGHPINVGSNSNNYINLNTTGNLWASVSWAVDEDGNVLSPAPSGGYGDISKGNDPISAIGAAGIADMDKFRKWIINARLDPNDPNDADLMLYKKEQLPNQTAANIGRQVFRLDQLQTEFDFADDEDIERSKRFRLISLREQEVKEFHNSKNIPPFDREIKDEVFRSYDDRKHLEKKPREEQRSQVSQYMQAVKEQIMVRFKMASHRKTFQDIISEDPMPAVDNLLPFIKNVFKPRTRKLLVTRKPLKKQPPQVLQGLNVKLLANIIRAVNIPVRSNPIREPPVPDSTTRGGTFMGTARSQFGGGMTRRDGGPMVAVRPLVQILFQGRSYATTVAEGSNPTWNEQQELAFRPPDNNYSPSNLQTIKDCIIISIFDECIIEEQQVDGTFKLSKPPILLGYANADPREKDTYITLFITLEPLLNRPDPFKDRLESNEEPKWTEASERWLQELESKYPKRSYKTLVIDINGKSTMITRFIKPLPPPPDVVPEGSSKMEAMRLIAKFVSMIPFVPDSVVFPGMCDIWATCEQFLLMKEGDEEEHAVLLCNYFLSLGVTAYLVLGLAIPEGPTAYVLTGESTKLDKLWNASTGEVWDVCDQRCALKRIDCLVSDKNIWANIQRFDEPFRLNFKINESSLWKPFLSTGDDLPSIQPEVLYYQPTDQMKVLNLKDTLERQIRANVESWRSRQITRWNRYCLQTFRNILEGLERNMSGNYENLLSNELKSIESGHYLIGFPINLAYSGESAVIERVRATGIHAYENQHIEFAVAVHIHPYPNDILSVWIFIASLVPKRM
ncbi:DgyrCDS2816 [Dimorphilus gyrociliatus]|uniref:DgyrCDS2816 n=1 Tax=Dimorphilus gyrociliatus TaxID=2664684 RepID=A0A7I8VBE5_9ANNE|nr:DgyrCDS2816 [Dimorphilus gyrociliatus]